MIMSYKPYNENLNTPTQHNPHSPASANWKPQPVEIPGVLHQSRQLYQPVVAEVPKDNK